LYTGEKVSRKTRQSGHTHRGLLGRGERGVTMQQAADEGEQESEGCVQQLGKIES
jgi:hypothetical protein